jgi:PncC family amidohydrolase
VLAEATVSRFMHGSLDELANDLLCQARMRDLKVCTAESCTAGRLGFALSKADGATHCFMGGIIAYTKEAKSRLLGVPPTMIERVTSVSGDVAEAMARGATARFGASIGIAVTGVAGPKPDEDGNPVGLIYVAVATEAGRSRHIRYFSRATYRDAIIEDACREALLLTGRFCTSVETRSIVER